VTVAGKSLAALAALAMAALAYRLVENPVRFHPYLLPRAALTLALAAATAVLSLAIATASGRVAVRLANAPQFRRIAAAAADFGRLPRAECVTLNESAEVRTCVFGDTSSESEVVLFGDSHAIQWFNPLQRLADAHHWKLTVMVKSACPASDIRTPGRGPVHDARCRSWRVSALRRIVAMRPSLVVIGNANADAGVTSASPSPNDITFDELRDGTRRTLQPLADAGVSVVLIRDNPRFPVSVPRCLARAARRPGRSAGACDVSRATVVNPAAFESEQAAARGLPTVHLFDVTDRLCAGNVCAAEREGVITYRDDGHLTGRYTDALLALVERDMAPFVRRAR
jgi:hypothetical protein